MREKKRTSGTQPGIYQQLEASRDKAAKSLRRKSQRTRTTPSKARSPRSQEQRVFREGVVSCAECCLEAQEREGQAESMGCGHKAGHWWPGWELFVSRWNPSACAEMSGGIRGR